MIVSEDGTVTGSIDRSRLGDVEAKSDEAKTQLEQLQGDVKTAEEQAEKDAERASQGERAVGVNTTGRVDDEDSDSKSQSEQKQDSERQQAETEKAGQEQQPAEDTAKLQAEAAAAGVTVDKRWGADRIRQEIDKANAAKTGKR